VPRAEEKALDREPGRPDCYSCGRRAARRADVAAYTMKKIFFPAALGFVLLIGAAFAIAQEGMVPGGNAAPPGPQPKAVIEKPLFDFGTALEGTMVRHTWKITNAGQSRLVIRGVKTSCGCTAAAPAKTNLAPGESTEISAGFDTRFQKGHQIRTITAYTNDPDSAASIMTIQGVVKQQVSATPAQVAFGDVRKGTELTKEVVISDLTTQGNFSVGTISNSNPAIKVAREKRPDGKPGALLRITLTKDMPAGPFDDTVTVVTTRIPVQIDVFGKVTGDLSVDPAQVSFGTVAHGGEAIRFVKLTSQSAKPVKVLGITSDVVAVSASAEPVTAGKEYKITVQLHRGTPDGQIHGQLQIKTDDPEQETLKVPFYGIVGQFQG
jgi:uncharacterized protein DUF1573/flagellar associated PapD-like protein